MPWHFIREKKGAAIKFAKCNDRGEVEIDEIKKLITNKTKIIATLGPSCSSKTMLNKLIVSGVDVFRINFSHADHKEVERIVNDIKSGLIDLAIAQHPAEIGYYGVVTAYAALTGQSIPVTIGTGFTVMDASNIDDPDVRKFIYSD